MCHFLQSPERRPEGRRLWGGKPAVKRFGEKGGGRRERRDERWEKREREREEETVME
jgi:hypothetical protein